MENIKVNFKVPKRQSLWIRTISFPKGPVNVKANVLCMTDQETHFDIIRMLHSTTTDDDEDDTILMDDRKTTKVILLEHLTIQKKINSSTLVTIKMTMTMTMKSRY